MATATAPQYETTDNQSAPSPAGAAAARLILDAAPTSFDPPDTGRENVRSLTPEELRKVYSGLGWRARRDPGGTAEPTAEMRPFRARGLYPDPGIYYRMVARDPIIASGLAKLELTFAALPWRVLPPKPPKRLPRGVVFTERDQAIEEARVEHVRNCLASLPMSLAGVASLAMARSYEAGFALAERVWEIEETSGWWRLEDLVWIEPWQVRDWIEDPETGFAVGVWLLGSGAAEAMGQLVTPTADAVVPWAKIAHWGRRFTGRNYEGQSSLRPLYWGSEAKRRALVREEMASDRFGLGTRVYKISPDAADVDMAAIRTIESEYTRSQQEWLGLPPGVDMQHVFGGSVMPNFGDKVRLLDHQIARMLDDSLQELGVSQFGARAVGSEMRKSSERAAEGLAMMLSHTLTRELIVPIYEQNGWPVQRAPYVHVSGFVDYDKWDAIGKLITLKVLDPKDPDIQEAARMELGLGR